MAVDYCEWTFSTAKTGSHCGAFQGRPTLSCGVVVLHRATPFFATEEQYYLKKKKIVEERRSNKTLRQLQKTRGQLSGRPPSCGAWRRQFALQALPADVQFLFRKASFGQMIRSALHKTGKAS